VGGVERAAASGGAVAGAAPVARSAAVSATPPAAIPQGEIAGESDTWDDDSDECSSLSSFDEEDSERLAQTTPPPTAQSNQAQATNSSVEAAAVSTNNTAAAAVIPDVVDAEDQEADRLVLEWSAGKSIVEMLATLHYLWPSAQPRDLVDAQGSSLSLSLTSPEGKATIRREYLRSVRKVHPDKVSINA